MKHPHREGASACAFNSTILAPFTVAKEVPSYSCDKTQKASIQFLQITSCFNHALEHEIVQHRRYNWIIRTRPDYLIYNPLPLPFDENSQILVSSPKPDILFAVPEDLLVCGFRGCHMIAWMIVAWSILTKCSSLTQPKCGSKMEPLYVM
jgi:hypothetical protein